MTCDFVAGDRCDFHARQVIRSHNQLRTDNDALLRPQRLYDRVSQYGGQDDFHLVHGELLACNIQRWKLTIFSKQIL